MNNEGRPKIQFRMLEVVLAVSVWGNATGLLYYVMRWVSKGMREPNFGVLLMLLVPSGLWVLEGAWWGLRRQNAIYAVTQWTSRWPLFVLGWLRVPLGFSLIMLVPTTFFTMVVSVYENQISLLSGVIMLSVLVVLNVIAWKWFRFIWNVRTQYDSEFVWHPKRKIGADGPTVET